MTRMTHVTVAAAMLGAAVLFGPDAEARDFRLAVSVSANHPWTLSANHFAEQVAALTEGRHGVEIYHGGQLGRGSTVMEAMRLGAIDFQVGGSTSSTDFIPEYQVFSLPYLFADHDEFEAVILHDESVLNRFKEIYAKRDLGLRLLALGGGNTRYFFSTGEPINTLEDIDGKVIRTPGSPLEDTFWSSFGSTTAAIPYGEFYSSLQTNVVDAGAVSLSGYYGSKLFEVANNLYPTAHEIYVAHYSMSAATADALDDRDMAAIQEAARRAAAFGVAEARRQEARLIDILVEEQGVNLVRAFPLDRFRAHADRLKPELAAQADVRELLAMFGN